MLIITPVLNESSYFAKMRLSQNLLKSQFFLFDSYQELLNALGEELTAEESDQIRVIASRGLPPITSMGVLSTMLGVSRGILRSMVINPQKHYRTFSIKTGKKVRKINAPKVALKIIQKWLSVQLVTRYTPPEHVFGFVQGKSHIDAAKSHLNSKWVYSVDIKDFFHSTSIDLVRSNLRGVGFEDGAIDFLPQLFCLNGFLSQGAPSSPILSNICFLETDEKLSELAKEYDLRLSRYADDIVFSGIDNKMPDGLEAAVESIFEKTCWELSQSKTNYSQYPNRLKVHGLLVHGHKVRLTKGYRNKIRAYKHLLAKGEIKTEDMSTIMGHVNYSNQIP